MDTLKFAHIIGSLDSHSYKTVKVNRNLRKVVPYGEWYCHLVIEYMVHETTTLSWLHA